VSWMFVSRVCCVLSGRGLCDEIIIRPEEFYRLWCVVVCEEALAHWRAVAPKEKKAFCLYCRKAGHKLLRCDCLLLSIYIIFLYILVLKIRINVC